MSVPRGGGAFVVVGSAFRKREGGSRGRSSTVKPWGVFGDDLEGRRRKRCPFPKIRSLLPGKGTDEASFPRNAKKSFPNSDCLR